MRTGTMQAAVGEFVTMPVRLQLAQCSGSAAGRRSPVARRRRCLRGCEHRRPALAPQCWRPPAPSSSGSRSLPQANVRWSVHDTNLGQITLATVGCVCTRNRMRRHIDDKAAPLSECSLGLGWVVWSSLHFEQARGIRYMAVTDIRRDMRTAHIYCSHPGRASRRCWRCR